MKEFYNMSIKYAYIEYTQNNHTDTYTRKEISAIRQEEERKTTQERIKKQQEEIAEQERLEKLEKFNELFIKEMKGEK